MTCERFASGKSILHSADPRVKILLAGGYAVITVGLGSLEGQVLALSGSLLLVMAARLSLKEVFHRLLVVNLFVLMLWFILPWTTPGTGVTHFGPIMITAEGLDLALSISLKCNAIILANLALLSTSTIFSLAHALAHFRIPTKMVQLIFFSWRYFHVIDFEFHRMKQAIKVRGFEPGSNLHTYRTYAYLIGTLFISRHSILVDWSRREMTNAMKADPVDLRAGGFNALLKKWNIKHTPRSRPAPGDRRKRDANQ